MGRRRVVSAALAVVVVAVIGGVAWWTRPATEPTPPPAGATPSVALPTPVVRTAGGQLDRVINYTTSAGTGTIRVLRATWTAHGEAAPQPGYVYLILDVEFTGVSGTPAAGQDVLVVRDSSGLRHLPAFGPGDQGTPDTVLSPGETLTGQAGFAVPPDSATLAVVDERLLDVATVAIPGP